MFEEIPTVIKTKYKHICTYKDCNASFSRPYRLEVHLKVHSEGKPFKCTYNECSRSYTNSSHLMRHLKENHLNLEKNVNFRCFLCNNMYSNSQNLERHLRKAHHNDFKCDHCGDCFKKKHQLLGHMFKHTGVKSFKCDQCSTTFVTILEKTKHQKRHKLHQCIDCPQTFQHWSKFLQHKKIHTPTEFICSHCQRVFKKRDHIVRHMKIHNGPKNKKKMVCPHCTKSYATTYNLKHHIHTVHNNVTFDCMHCSAKLATKAKLNNHILLHHEKNFQKVTARKKNSKKRNDKGTFKNSIIGKIFGIEVSVPRILPENNNIL